MLSRALGTGSLSPLLCAAAWLPLEHLHAHKPLGEQQELQAEGIMLPIAGATRQRLLCCECW
jgi:hypothetical protein